MLKTRIILILLLQFSFLKAQNVQWASKVIGYSSQFSRKEYAAKQALGKPNVLPDFRDSPCAWSPLQEESRTDEYLHVGFSNPMRISQVVVGESHNPGAVSQVILFDTRGQTYPVYTNSMTRALPEPGRILRVTFPLTSYKVASVKIVLNTLGIPDWNHIDAIGISDAKDPIQAKIKIVENLEFESGPENLGSSVNSEYDEIMPIISPDGKTLFFDRKDHPSNSGSMVNDDIWYSHQQGEGVWSTAINMGAPLNNQGHNFLTAISPDGNTALLGNVYEPDGSMSWGLSIASRKAGGWGFPQKLVIRNYYNNNKYSEFHMGADGKTVVMTIQRRDSYGGKDLYVSFKNVDGTWSEPKNLGSTVNSAATEMSPFLAADGKTLYFSSDGFSGYGSKDMYMAKRLDDSWLNWSEPQNLGPTINSANWDAYYSLPASGEYAYFSSENNSIGKTDIFRIKLPRELKPDPVILIRGKVLDEETKKPVVAKIIYETLSDGKEIGVATSSPETGEYSIVLPAGEKYGFFAQSPKYVSVHQNLDLRDTNHYDEIQQDLSLIPIKKGKTITLNNIFFSPAKAHLTPESDPELNRVVQLMQENKSLKIEIEGHTDNGCSEAFCQELSLARAKRVYDYLVEKGVSDKRMSFRGYGSSKPKESNETPEGKRVNRRVEFTILKT